MAKIANHIWIDEDRKDAAKDGVWVIHTGPHHGLKVFEGIRCDSTAPGPEVFRL